MATALTAIFGNEIKVALQPRAAQRQYVGFAGTHGLAALHMGSRGWGLVVTGRLRANVGGAYNAGRDALVTAIQAIEQYQWLGAADYSFAGTTYYNVVFEEIRILSGAGGKQFHFTGTGDVVCDFVANLRGLL